MVMTIGDKIKRLRELKNFTQKGMADKIGMSETGYSKIERDETDIPYSRLEQIATALNIKVEDIVAFDEKYVFNNYGEIKQNHLGSVQNNFPETVQQLYNDKISLLEDKINYLQDVITGLKQK